MRVFTSVLSNSINRLLDRPQSKTCPNKTNRRRQTRRMTIESLERREVFSTDLLSAFAIGNDTGNTIARSVDVDSAGNSYMAGVFRGTVDFDPTSVVHPGDTDILTARGGADGYIAKYGPDNSLLWARRMGGDSPTINGAIDEVKEVKVDNNGNAYVVGNFVGSNVVNQSVINVHCS